MKYRKFEQLKNCVTAYKGLINCRIRRFNITREICSPTAPECTDLAKKLYVCMYLHNKIYDHLFKFIYDIYIYIFHSFTYIFNKCLKYQGPDEINKIMLPRLKKWKVSKYFIKYKTLEN